MGEIIVSYFETTIINDNQRVDFDISVNEDLYNYLTWHDDAHSLGEDWFAITLTKTAAETIQALCKTDEEKELIGKNIQEGTIIDILIHRVLLVKKQ